VIEINVLSWYTEAISTEKTGNRHVSRRKVVQMTEHNATSLSASLVNRKVYTVCYTGLDTLSSFHDALYEARRSYFGSGKTVHIRARGIFDGLSGEVHGKLSRRTIKWKKRAGKNTLEAAFTNGGQRGIAFYNAYGALRARVYYDGEMQWMRTEYFSPDDDRRARITFKPDDHRDAVIRFDYNDSTGKTKETVLFPVPYAFQTAEQSLQNAQFGDRLLLVADERGEYAYCPREEQQRRIKFLKQNKNASVMLSMGWEVKDGDVPETTEPESELPVFENLTEPALVDFLSDPAEKAAESTEEEPEEIPEEPAPEETPKTDSAPGITPEELRQARALLDKLLPAKEAEKEDDPENGITLIRGGASLRYTGDLSEDGKREGFGRTVNNNGITLYEGEYKNDLREGFGVHHYRSGAVSYIGDFKDDQREGFGVSFRESDHALHISHWQNGKPQGMATIFNKNGDLIYNGQIIDGQKQGAGVSVDPETHCVFVEKYENNEKAGQATLFDADGNLIYSGGWQNGKRQGHGTAFDKNGNVIYTGEWKDDRYENGILYRHVQNEDKA
jgi:antitoxin component YwqK of YwqJK toxin-antitoxin module